MKILFLDIDGPIVNRRAFYAIGKTMKVYEGLDSFDPVAVGMINSICKKTGAKIVISSAWRDIEKHLPNLINIKTKLLSEGILDFFHEDYITPITEELRGKEIQDWLNKHPDCNKWCAIDDRDMFLDSQKDKVVLVSREDGMTCKSYERVLDILS